MNDEIILESTTENQNFAHIGCKRGPNMVHRHVGVECPEMLITPMGTHLQGFYEPPTSVLSEKQVFAPIMSHCIIES